MEIPHSSVISLVSQVNVNSESKEVTEELPITQFLPISGQTDSCTLYATNIPVSMANALSEGTVLQIPPNSAILAVSTVPSMQDSNCVTDSSVILNEVNQEVKDENNIMSLITLKQGNNTQSLSYEEADNSLVSVPSISLLSSKSLISTSSASEASMSRITADANERTESISMEQVNNIASVSSVLTTHTENISSTSLPLHDISNMVPISSIDIDTSHAINSVSSVLLDHPVSINVASDSEIQISNTSSSLTEVTNIIAKSSKATESSVHATVSNSLPISSSNITSGPETIGELDFSSFLEQDDSQSGSVLNDEVEQVSGSLQSDCNNLISDVCNHSEVNNNDAEKNDNGNDSSNVVIIDVSKPIQLSQNSLIVVNGQKCVLQHDPQTGQVVAYPIKEPDKPKKKRGRPRKSSDDPQQPQQQQQQEKQQQEIFSEEDEDINVNNAIKGMMEVTTDDGAIVRRSCRKRKKVQTLRDYETGNLKLELGSDEEDADMEIEEEDENQASVKRRTKSRGRPRKFIHQSSTGSFQLSFLNSGKRGRGRPRRYGISKETTQAFLIQTTEGPSFVMQVPTSSIPTGMSLQDVAQGIANSLNLTTAQTLTGPMSITLETPTNENSSSDKIIQENEIVSSSELPDDTSFDDNILNNREVEERNERDQDIDSTSKDDDDDDKSDLSPPQSVISLSEQSPPKQKVHKPPAIVVLSAASPVVKKRGPGRPRKTPLSENSTIEPSNTSDTLLSENMSSETDTKLPSSVEPSPAVTSSITTVVPLANKLLPAILPKQDSPVKLGLKASETELERLICPRCNFQAYYAQQYQEHLATHTKEAQHCKCCTFLCFEEDELIKHYKDHHPKCICDICNHTAEHAYTIKRHILRHSDQGCMCNICGKTYKDHYILKMHQKMVHMPAEVLFECDICKKKFNRRAHLKRHLRTHDPDKPFRCDQCDYRGCERSDINKHVLIHEDPKHICDICGKTFRHVKNKELHLKRHKGQRDYKCGVCDFYGYTFTDIRKHIERRHSDSKTILCTKCGQAFQTDALMKEHQKTKQCEIFVMEQTLNEAETAVIEMPRTEDTTISQSQSNSIDQPNITIDPSEIITEETGIAGIATIQLPDGSIAALNTITNADGQIVISGVDTSGIFTQDGQLTIVSRPEEITSGITFVAAESSVDDSSLNQVQSIEINDENMLPMVSHNEGNPFSNIQVTMVTGETLDSIGDQTKEPQFQIEEPS